MRFRSAPDSPRPSPRPSGVWPVVVLLLACILPLTSAPLGALRAADDPAKKDAGDGAKKGAEDAKKEAPEPRDLIGAKVTVKMQSGKTLQDVEVAQLPPGRIPGTFQRLVVLNAHGRKITLAAKAVKELSTADGTVQLAYDPVTHSLAPADPDRLAEIHRLAKAGRSKTARSGKRSGAGSAEPDAKISEAKRQEIFKKTGVWLWPDLTQQQQADELAKRRDFLKKVVEQFPDLRVAETQYFLFATDMPPAAAKMYLPSLDKMYQQLSNAFAIKAGTNIFPGKAIIIAFARADGFTAFEKKFYEHDARPDASGLSHLASDGTVVISCFCRTTPRELAAVMVHETTHGFVHRYKSSQQLPTWLNEGLAEWVAWKVVNGDESLVIKQRAGMMAMQQRHNMGGNFFSTENLDAYQYGIAAALTDFLIRHDLRAFRELIEQIKQGQPWATALKNTYHVTPEELARGFGMSLKIPNLGP